MDQATWGPSIRGRVAARTRSGAARRLVGQRIDRAKFLAQAVGAHARLGLQRTGLLHARVQLLVHGLASGLRLRLARGQAIALGLGGGPATTQPAWTRQMQKTPRKKRLARVLCIVPPTC